MVAPCNNSKGDVNKCNVFYAGSDGLAFLLNDNKLYQWRTAFVHNSSTLAPSVNDVNTHAMSLNLRLSWCGSLLTQLAE